MPACPPSRLTQSPHTYRKQKHYKRNVGRVHCAAACQKDPSLSDTAIDFLYLSEPDMIAAGVTDMSACVDAMEQTFALLHRGDYRMSGSNHNSHGALINFPDESPFPTMPRNGADRRFMAMPAYL